MENAQKLITALKSGAYRQTTKGCLKDDTGYCILGVACDISGLGEWVYLGSTYQWYYVAYRTWHECTPPNGLYKWIGITSEDLCSLIERNDTDKITFDQAADEIAEIVERYKVTK